MTDKAISPLRQRMIEDMTIRKLASKTQHDYLQRVKNFAAFLGRSPDTARFEDGTTLSAASGRERRRRTDPQPDGLDTAVLFPGHAGARRHHKPHPVEMRAFSAQPGKSRKVTSAWWELGGLE